jgi:hypothetical protein
LNFGKRQGSVQPTHQEVAGVPITYTVRGDGHFVHTKATGPVTADELLGYQKALLEDPRVRSGCYELFDATGAHSEGLSDTVMGKIVEVDKQHGAKLKGGKCAIVVRTDFELLEKFEQRHAGPHEIMVFFNLDVARAWLGDKARDT